MFIIDVIPLALIPRNQTQILSYFNSEPLTPGAVVEVFLGTRKIKAVVISSDSIKNQKLIFKKNVDFKLKNIIRVLNPEPQVSDWQLHIANCISSYYYAPLGICLKTILPSFWGKRGYKITVAKTRINTEKPPQKFDFINSNLKNHGENYAEIIREQLGSGKQIFLMVPENTAAQYFMEYFSEFNPAFISGSLSNKEFYEVWKRVEQNKPQLIIGTRTGLFLPFSNLGAVIIDDESNEFYKSDMMPRYNAADLALKIASDLNAKILIGGSVPRIETCFKISEPFPKYESHARVINMVDEIKNANFSVFSRLLKEKIIQNENYMILYVPRRGHANFTLCQKCGQSIKCPNCSASLVLHKAVSAAPAIKLICHHCNYQTQEPKLCPNCGSYQLKHCGIGTEKVVDELKKLERELARASAYNKNIIAKKINVFRLDSDLSRNIVEKEIKILDDFRKTKPSVLVTTQIIFSYKYLVPHLLFNNTIQKNRINTEKDAGLLNVPIIGIINADTLINIPDFRAEESLFRQIYTLGRITDKLIIQTHNSENVAIKFASSGNIREFINQELENREFFGYPPFSQFIKLSYRHKNPVKARNEARIVFEKLKIALRQVQDRQQKIDIEILGLSPAFISKERGYYIWNIVIKNPVQFSGENHGAGRNEFLRFVPSGWTIDVDPVRII